MNTARSGRPEAPDPTRDEARARRRRVAATLLGGSMAAWHSSGTSSIPLLARPAPERPVRLALIGDVPYGRLEELRLLKVFDHLSTRADLALHVGDLKGSSEPCSDALLDRRISLLSRCPVPLVYTPGDNDWLDCWREKAGKFDPEERLQWLRRRVFSDSHPILGGPPGDITGLTGIERQSDIDGGPPENLRWQAGGACWITLNLPGSNNGLRAATPDAHRINRDRTNRRWLEAGVARAKERGAGAMVVAVQANPGFERMTRPLRDSSVRAGIGEHRASEGASAVKDGYAPFRADLLDAQRALGKPLLLLHGDTHRFRHDWITPGLLRVECFGSPFAESWVRILVDGNADTPFRVSVEHL